MCIYPVSLSLLDKMRCVYSLECWQVRLTEVVCCRSKVYLEIDNRKCSERSMDCFSSTELAASFIAAEYLKSALPYPVVSVDSKSLSFFPL